MQEMLNTHQVAHEFGLSASWLTKLRVTGQGCRYAKIGAKVLYRRCDVAEWIESQLRTSTSDPGLADKRVFEEAKLAGARPRGRRGRPRASSAGAGALQSSAE